MAERNQLVKGIVSHTESRTTTATPTNYGSGGESYDENYGTYFGIKGTSGGGGSITSDATGEHTWTTPIDITRVKAKLYAKSMTAGNYGIRELDFIIYVYYSGAWHIIYSKDNDEAGTGTTEETNEQNLTTGWTGVTGVKVYCKARADGYEGGDSREVNTYLYEVQAFYTVKKSFSGVV